MIVLVATVLRLHDFGRGGLVHFDEGAYTCGGLAISSLPLSHSLAAGGLSPLIAPPMTFLAIGAVFSLVGVADWVAAVVPLAAGIATVAMTAVLARQWFRKDLPAIAAAAFLATLQYHVVFSRLVLSDAPFLLTLVIAMACFWSAGKSGSWKAYAVAGIATGICWNTKYHGFLPIVFHALFLLLDRTRLGAGLHGVTRVLPKLILATAIAAAMVVPHVLFIADDLGIVAFLDHRRQFISTQLVHNVQFMVTCFVKLMPGVFWPLVALGAAAALRCRRRGDRYLTVVLVVWCVLSPWYTPYPRLYLPLAFTFVLCAARGVACVATLRRPAAQSVAIVIVTTVALFGAWQSRSMDVSQSGYRDAADKLNAVGLSDRPAILACQDAMRFYLLRQPDRTATVAPTWAPGFRYDDRRWAGSVVCIVDAVYQGDPALTHWLRGRKAELRAVVDNPLPWVVAANYPGRSVARGNVFIYAVPALHSSGSHGNGQPGTSPAASEQ